MSKASKNTSHRKLYTVGSDAPFQFVEAYKSLRTNLEFLSSAGNCKTILITSSVPEEGKSNVAVNLAMTLTASGNRVVLVDCDLRKATISRYMRIPRNHGTDLKVRIDVMTCLYSQRTGDKLMMQCLIAQLFGIDWIPEIAVDTSSCHHTKLDLCTVDFVKGEPIFHLALVPLEDGLAVTQIMSDHLPVRPAALIGKCIRRFIVADGDHRLNTVLV